MIAAVTRIQCSHHWSRQRRHGLQINKRRGRTSNSKNLTGEAQLQRTAHSAKQMATRYLALRIIPTMTDSWTQCTRIGTEVGCIRCKGLGYACSFEQAPSTKSSKPRVLNRLKCDFCRSSKQKVFGCPMTPRWAKKLIFTVPPCGERMEWHDPH